MARVAEQLGINPETLRNWVTQTGIDAGERPGTKIYAHDQDQLVIAA